jgi:tetratricopeptide (TPR) repeat protein
MSKHKKAGQSRKKHRKAGQKKTGISSRSKPSFSSAYRISVWVLGIFVIVCAIAAGIFSIRFLLIADRKPLQMKPSSDNTQTAVPNSVSGPLRTKQDVIGIKEEELKLAEKLIADFPDNGQARILVGDLHRRLGNSVKAVEFWQKGLELIPKQADVYSNLGIVALEKGDFEQAISFWRKALDVNPQMPGVHNSIARALIGLGRHDEAIKELQEDIKISPQSPDSNFLLGQAFLQQQDYENAKIYYEKAIELQPNNLNAYYGLSTTYARLKNPEKAAEYMAVFKKLRAQVRQERNYGHSPLDDLARMRRSFAELSMGAARLYDAKGQLTKAEELLKQAVAADPNEPASHKRLAAFYQKMGRIPAALNQCEQVSQLEPNDSACHLLIATLALQLQRADRAETAFKKFIELCPNQSLGYRELAHLYIMADTKSAEAVRLAQKAVGLEPAAENYFILAYACQKTNDKQAALTAIQKAMELAPNNLEYRRMYDLIRHGG